MSNIRDVAKLSGVSISTVSRFVTHSAKVNEETQKKIQDAIEMLNYHPNVLARGVLTKKSGKIGLIIPSVANPFFPELYLAIEKCIQEQGYTLLVHNVKGNRELEKQAIREFEENRVEGILIARTENPDLYLKTDLKIVAIENDISVTTPLVISDNILGGKLAFDLLYELGCKKIIHLAGDDIYLPAVYRKRGFIEQANSKGLSVDVIKVGKDFLETPYDKFEGLFENIETYDGIFVFNDVLAMKVIQYISKRNLFYEIGKSINIIGFDNISTTELISPTLTTISQDVQRLGTTSAEVLMDLMHNKEVNKIYKTEVCLVERDSTSERSGFNGENSSSR